MGADDVPVNTPPPIIEPVAIILEGNVKVYQVIMDEPIYPDADEGRNRYCYIATSESFGSGNKALAIDCIE